MYNAIKKLFNLYNKEQIELVDTKSLNDKELLKIVQHRFEEINDPYLTDLLERFHTYARVQSIFATKIYPEQTK